MPNHNWKKWRMQFIWLVINVNINGVGYVNQEYETGHFDSGKCKGLQFFKPKDDYEIKLAQEGKIELRGSEIQPDFEDDFGLDFIEIRRIEGENNNNNIVHDNKLKKVKLIIIYIFFGFLILSFILGFNISPNIRKRYLILFYLYFLLFGLIYYFIIFTLNIVMLAPLIILCGFTKFIDNCDEACNRVDYYLWIEFKGNKIYLKIN